MTHLSSLDVSLDDRGDVLVRPHERVGPCLRLRPYEWDRFLFELACYMGERSKLTREPHRIRREYGLDSRLVLGGNMRKAFVSLAAAALAVPLALAGTASAATSAPAHLTGTYYTNVGHTLHVWHVDHVEHMAHLGYY